MAGDVNRYDAAGGEGVSPSEIGGPLHTEPWREQLSAKLTQYRARRRPRAPRYPSLQMRFETVSFARRWQSVAPAETGEQDVGVSAEIYREESAAEVEAVPAPAVAPSVVENTGRVLEFPRAATMPARPTYELADPVLERPRILDVPEMAPAPPALGGILIEPVPLAIQATLELPLQAASLGRRLLAALLDMLIVSAGCTVFGYLFFRITRFVPSIAEGRVLSLACFAIFWVAYQYLFLVKAGTTPGLAAAKLSLRGFDGGPVRSRARRERVLAGMLSVLSMGLGHIWCLLDEDELGWHDRITRTYMVPRSQSPRSPTGD